MEDYTDYKIGDIVPVFQNGEPAEMKVIGHNSTTKQVHLQHLYPHFGTEYKSVPTLKRLAKFYYEYSYEPGQYIRIFRGPHINTLPKDDRTLCCFVHFAPGKVGNVVIQSYTGTYQSVKDFRAYNLENDYTHYYLLEEPPLFKKPSNLCSVDECMKQSSCGEFCGDHCKCKKSKII